MRLAGLLLLVAAAGCAPSGQHLSGTLTYVTNPPEKDLSGTLPLTIAVCTDPDRTSKYDLALRLGDDCVLHGKLVPGMNSPPLKPIGPKGTCSLPTASGEVRFDHVDGVIFEPGGVVGWRYHHYVRPFSLVVSGTTATRAYATYRFEPMARSAMPSEECAALLAE